MAVLSQLSLKVLARGLKDFSLFLFFFRSIHGWCTNREILPKTAKIRYPQGCRPIAPLPRQL
ncbi:MAG: hypothetical protein RMJ16_09625 [Thermoguttaceae bacterium]|nr:hypothetical protein [Thermoguttaceae bacterium]